MISIIVILFLKLCLAQDFPSYQVSQDNDYLRASKVQNDRSLNNVFYEWRNNFDNNVIIPDAYVLHLCCLILIM